MQRAWIDQLNCEGYAIIPDVLRGQQVEAIVAALEAAGNESGPSEGRGEFAVRNLLGNFPAARELAASPLISSLVGAVLGHGHFPVRGILFDKVPGANWKVPWHQDVTIAVKERIETVGFGPWSEKAGVLHVQAPADVLGGMLSVRVHLDDCDEKNGALRVIPGSHRHGKIPEREVQIHRNSQLEVICDVSKGGVLLMRPLLLHASSQAAVPRHRRVLHIDFAASALPGALVWSPIL